MCTHSTSSRSHKTFIYLGTMDLLSFEETNGHGHDVMFTKISSNGLQNLWEELHSLILGEETIIYIRDVSCIGYKRKETCLPQRLGIAVMFYWRFHH